MYTHTIKRPTKIRFKRCRHFTSQKGNIIEQSTPQARPNTLFLVCPGCGVVWWIRRTTRQRPYNSTSTSRKLECNSGRDTTSERPSARKNIYETNVTIPTPDAQFHIHAAAVCGAISWPTGALRAPKVEISSSSSPASHLTPPPPHQKHKTNVED